MQQITADVQHEFTAQLRETGLCIRFDVQKMHNLIKLHFIWQYKNFLFSFYRSTQIRIVNMSVILGINE